MRGFKDHGRLISLNIFLDNYALVLVGIPIGVDLIHERVIKCNFEIHARL